MDQMHQLAANLKRLRMPGIIESLDIRCREASETDLGYREFLYLVIQDEIANREANNLAKRVKWGGLSGRHTFESFDFRFNGEVLPPQAVRDLATGTFVEKRENLILCGPPGMGKTHIAQAIGHEVCRRGYEVLFFKTHKLLEALADSSYPRRTENLRRRCARTRLLILDDFGFRRYDSREAETLYALSDERLGQGSTILTSNRPVDDWYSVFPDPVIGGAVLDRLVSSALKMIVEKARSYRKEGKTTGKETATMLN